MKKKIYYAPEVTACGLETQGVLCGSICGSITDMTVLDAIDGDESFD